MHKRPVRHTLGHTLAEWRSPLQSGQPYAPDRQRAQRPAAHPAMAPPAWDTAAPSCPWPPARSLQPPTCNRVRPCQGYGAEGAALWTTGNRTGWTMLMLFVHGLSAMLSSLTSNSCHTALADLQHFVQPAHHPAGKSSMMRS